MSDNRRSRSRDRGRRDDRDRNRDSARDRHQGDDRGDRDRRRDRPRSRERDARTRDNDRKSSRDRSRDRDRRDRAEEAESSRSGNTQRTPAAAAKPDSSKEAPEPTPEKAEGSKKEDVPDWVRDLVEPQARVAPAPTGAPTHRFVVIPQQFVSKVVGFQGCTVNEIQLATRTYIQMNQETRDKGYSVATITSSEPGALDRAEAMIKERIDSGQRTQQMYAKGAFGMGKGGRIQLGL